MPIVPGFETAIADSRAPLQVQQPLYEAPEDNSGRLRVLALDLHNFWHGATTPQTAALSQAASDALMCALPVNQERLVRSIGKSTEIELTQLSKDLLRLFGVIVGLSDVTSSVPIMPTPTLSLKQFMTSLDSDPFAGATKSLSLTLIEEGLQMMSLPALAMTVTDALNEQVCVAYSAIIQYIEP
jgi:hypothetical protein